VTGTRVFLGKFADLLRAVPPHGGVYQDLPVRGLLVSHSRLVRQRGGLGTLTVYLSTRLGEDNFELEVEWGLLEKPIETAPPFKNLSDAEREHVRLWEDLGVDASKRREAFEYPTVNSPDPGSDGDWAALSGAALLLAKKKAKGVEVWQTPAPVVRRTRESITRPTTTRCGRRETPPVSISGYQFVKTSDKATRSGRAGPWSRVEEWTGAEEWDSDLYPT